MKILFAQGNPGASYSNTRHNIGFFVVDALAKKWECEFSEKTKFNAQIAETTLRGEKILLVKPLSYYNETGSLARKLLDFYKLNPATDLLVIHDELALPLGVIRTRLSGSDAGNNGIKSLNTHLGLAYARLRIGVYAPLRDQINDADFVLGKFTQEEQAVLHDLWPHIEEAAEAFIAGAFQPTKRSIDAQG